MVEVGVLLLGCQELRTIYQRRKRVSSGTRSSCSRSAFLPVIWTRKYILKVEIGASGRVPGNGRARISVGSGYKGSSS